MNRFGEFCKSYHVKKQDVAKILGRTNATMTARAKGESQFTARDIDSLRKEFDLQEAEVVYYFIENA